MYNFGIPEIGLFAVLIAVLVFEIAMIVNLWRSTCSNSQKMLWTIAMLVFNPISAIIYFFGFKNKQQGV